MATTESPPRKPRSSSTSFAGRMTAKVGPLPVWAWAAIILAIGYVVYKRTASSSSTSSTDTSSTDTSSTDATPDATGGTPGPDNSGGDNGTGSAGAGGAADNLNGSILSQLAGYGDQLDALTQLIQSSPAFWVGSGDSGSGSIVPNGSPAPIVDGGMIAGGSMGGASGSTTKTTKAAATVKPAPTLVSEHGAGGGFTVAAPAPKTRYYTYAPGKAPKGRTADQAPAHGPSGTTLRFASGRGYFYA